MSKRSEEPIGRDWQQKVGEAIIHFDRYQDNATPANFVVTRLTINTPHSGRADWMIVAKGYCEQQAVVAFYSAPSLAEAIRGFWHKLAQGELKLHEDKPFKSGLGDR